MKTLTRRGRLFGKDFRTFSKRISEKCSKHTISFGEWPLVSIFLFVWREIFAVTTTTNQITVWPYLSQIEQMYKTSKMEGRGGMVIFFQILHQLFLWDLWVVRYWVLKGRQIFEKKKIFELLLTNIKIETILVINLEIWGIPLRLWPKYFCTYVMSFNFLWCVITTWLPCDTTGYP